MVWRRPQHAASSSAYLALFSVRWYPSSSRLVHSPTSRPSSSRSFPFVGFPGGDTQCPSIISYHADVPCPGPLPSYNLFNHVCDLCLFSYSDACLCLWCLTYSFPSLFVRLLACSWLEWCVPMFARRMSFSQEEYSEYGPKGGNVVQTFFDGWYESIRALGRKFRRVCKISFGGIFVNPKWPPTPTDIIKWS